MVMEAPPNSQMIKEGPPNPQCVGREFVRQYYTLLNASPSHLHRFYNNNSSFVHGGLDASNRETEPVVGQKEIHQKIQQLNFHDCHARISQVDSQATLGNGVVVQVTGELSNCGQPMRRFTQTFVLASQSPKQYYVHNDIFRYQDIMFSDEEVEQDSGHSAAEEEICSEHTPKPEAIVPTQQIQPSQTGPLAYYNTNTAVTNNSPVNSQITSQLPASLPHQMATTAVAVTSVTPTTAAPPPPPPPTVTPTVTAVVNGSAHPEEVISPTNTVAAAAAPVVQPIPQPPMSSLPNLNPMSQAPVPIQSSPSAMTPLTPKEEEVEPENPTEDTNETWVDPDSNAWTDDASAWTEPPSNTWGEPDSNAEEEKEKPIETIEETSHHVPETTSNEPKTYATLVKTGGIGVGTSSFSSTVSTSCNVQSKPTTSPPPTTQRSVDSRDNLPVSSMSSSGGLGLGQRGARRGGSVRGMARTDRGSVGRGNFNEDSSNAGGDGHNRRLGNQQQYADNQQLFMGNLPLQATEEELRALFGKFGPILDLRVLSKANSKNTPGNRVPNYGFIVFENEAIVQTVLNSRPIYYPDESGQKLNVEEKKTKLRAADNSRMGSGGDTMLGGGRPNSGMGGGRGGPGMMRGGPGIHRGGGRGSFSRGDGRGGGMNRASYTRR